MKAQIVLTLLAVLLGAVGGARADAANTANTANTDGRGDFEKMAAEHQGDHPTATPAARTAPSTAVTGENVVYGEVGGKKLHGFLARPQGASGPLPAIIVIHEWWGLNDNIRDMARRLAGEGYAALAVDLYGGAKADNPDQAMQLMQAAMKDKPAGEANVRAAYHYLTADQHATRVGVIGWCFGGGWSFSTALLLPDKLAATVIYYGPGLPTDKSRLAPLKMPILGFFGGQDQSIPVASVRQFEAALKELGKPVEIHIYENAKHAFANASGGNYNAEAATDSWQRTVAFLAKNLKG
jgi:carboxymethylenebutenolidase